jgi:hypothetical protein
MVLKTLKNILLSSVLSLSLACTLPYNYLPNKENYSGVVVFAYTTEQIPKEKRENQFYELTNDLIKGELQESVESWYKNQAKKYGKSIDINLTEYKEEIQIPKQFLIEGEYPLDGYSLTSYLKSNYKELRGYDFISIFYQIPEWEGVKSPTFANTNAHSFVILYSHTSDEISGQNNSIFAHEFAHLIGATDKWKEEGISEFEIMNYPGGVDLFNEKVFIGEKTSREIGW